MDELDNSFGDIFSPETNLETAQTNESSNVFKDDEFFNDNSGTEISNPTVSVLDEYLINNGVKDTKITVVDENNIEKEVGFYDLSKEEQLDVLNSFKTNDIVLQEEEENLIKFLREKNMSLESYLKTYEDQVSAKLQESIQQSYDIDAYDDNELYLLDLKQKYDLSEEELKIELEKGLQDEELFKKKVTALRKEYKGLEDQYKESLAHEERVKQEEQFNQFQNKMVDVALKTPDFYGIELEDTEKDEILSFLLDVDDKGVTDFAKSLNDPEKLYEIAWFSRYGKESIDALKNVYESEINRLREEISKKEKVTKVTENKEVKTINDLFKID